MVVLGLGGLISPLADFYTTLSLGSLLGASAGPTVHSGGDTEIPPRAYGASEDAPTGLQSH